MDPEALAVLVAKEAVLRATFGTGKGALKARGKGGVRSWEDKSK